MSHGTLVIVGWLTIIGSAIGASLLSIALAKIATKEDQRMSREWLVQFHRGYREADRWRDER